MMGRMKTFLIALSGVVTIGASLPYMLEILRGTTKPRIVTWFTWMLLTAIGSAASFADGQLPTAILMLCGSIGLALVVVLGFKHSDRSLERLDIVCLVGAAVGLALWMIFNSPTIGVLAAVTIDFVGAIPTLKHSWQKPHEETWVTYALIGLGGGITLLIVDEWTATAVAYPIYLVLLNIALVGFIVANPKKRIPSPVVEVDTTGPN